MLKKLQKHIIDIATSDDRAVYGTFDGIHYLANKYKIISFDEEVPDFPKTKIQGMSPEVKENVIDRNVKSDDVEWILHNLVSANVIKKQVNAVIGRKREATAWSDDGEWAINPKWLVQAMEALNATVCYIPKGPKSYYYPVKLFQNDDVTSPIWEGIMQIRNDNKKTGVWLKNEKS